MPQRFWRSVVVAAVWALPVWSTAACFGTKSDPAQWLVAKDPESGRLLIPVKETELLLDVMRELLADRHNNHGSEDHRLLLIEESLPIAKSKAKKMQLVPAAIVKELPGTDKECVRTLMRNNTQRYFLPPTITTPESVQTASISEINRLMHPNGWPSLAEQRPNLKAIISAARPALCKNDGLALVYIVSSTTASTETWLMLAELKLTEVNLGELILSETQMPQWTIKQKIRLTDVNHHGPAQTIMPTTPSPTTEHRDDAKPKS